MTDDPQRTAPQRRQSARVELRVPVVVKWVTKDGSPQEESTETKFVNTHGCLVLLRSEVSEGLRIELVNGDTQKVQDARVVWCGVGDRTGGTHAGIALEAPNPKFWGERYNPHIG